MNKTDRLKKANIMNRLRKKDSTNSVSIKEFCRLLRLNGLSHNHGYFHYTTLGRLKKMLTSVDVGEQKRRLFVLSSASLLNDTLETKPGFYLASFSFGKEEEVAMWTNYGVPKREAVRIRFPMAAMTEWIRENTPDRIVIYVREGENQPFHALDEKPIDIYFADVAYYAGNDPSPRTVQDALRYKGEHFKLKEKKWRRGISKTNDSLLFKKRGWEHEREVRLIVQFKDTVQMQRYHQIAIPFDSVYDAMLEAQNQKGTSVMYGPWYRKEDSALDKIKGINVTSLSSFQGELRMRSNCDSCELKGNKKCTCRKAEWLLLK